MFRLPPASYTGADRAEMDGWRQNGMRLVPSPGYSQSVRILRKGEAQLYVCGLAEVSHRDG
jgi:hypothetical protein